MLGLHNALASQAASVNQRIYTFDDIEALIGRSLPPSTRSGNAWGWTNAACSRSRWWLSAGWHVWRADHRAQTVEFRRLPPLAAKP